MAEAMGWREDGTPAKGDNVFPVWIVTVLPAGLSGLILGGVERQIADLLRVFDRNARVVATGGGAALWTPHLPSIERIIPDLTLRGIVRALEAREEA